MGKLSNYSSFAALAVASATALHVAIKDFNDTAAPQVPHSFADIAERARPGTVFVSLKGSILPDKDGKTTPGGSSGSGFIINGKDGYVVTNNHVIEGAVDNDQVAVSIRLTNGKTLNAKIVGRDAVADIAVLKVDAPYRLPEIRWGNSDKLRVGDWVVAIGNPFGLIDTTTAGVVSSLNRNVSGPYGDIIQTDAAINKGNSGGALFNSFGEVVGVNTAIYSPNGGSVGIGFSVPSNRVLKIAETIIAHGDIKHGWLGIAMADLTAEMGGKAGLDHHDGIVVKEVVNPGPAHTAGLKQGDIVLSANGQKITSPQQLSRLIIDCAAGSDLNVVYWRNGAEHSVTVKLGDYNTLLELQKKAAEGKKEEAPAPKVPDMPIPEIPAPE